MNDTVNKDQWLSRVLGVSFSRPTPPPPVAPVPPPRPLRQVRFAPLPGDVVRPNGGGLTLNGGRPRSKAVVTPPPLLPPRDFVGAGGKTITIAKRPNGGGTVYTAPPPPVGEITFSGGGGKGAALPGAIKALQESGVLKDAKKIAGASVGSMTAALVASGITADEFTNVANDDDVTARMVEGTGGTKIGLLMRAMKNNATTESGSPLTGQGIEDVVRDVLDQTLKKRIQEYVVQCNLAGGRPDPAVMSIAERLAGNQDGATFGDLRRLSGFIPAVKEVVITGTYTTEMSSGSGGQLVPTVGGNDQGQLYVFDADSEPTMPVAKAVHASASFPVAFKPVDLKLASGMTVRFIDGGVMNNTPTSSSIGNEAKLDPMPATRGMSFVFEEKGSASKDLLEGRVTPGQGKAAQLIDWGLSSDHHASEYAKNRDLVDRPEEIIVVPLQVQLPAKKGKKGKKFDMRGGTLEFNLPLEAKVAFQEATEKATNEQIAREQQPKTREFASDSQMFVSIGLPELRTLAAGGYAGADAALVFRERVAEMIDKLAQALKAERAKTDGRTAEVLNDKDARMALDELDTLARDDVDFQGYVARELHKSGMPTLLDAIRAAGLTSDVLDATAAVGDAVKANRHADNILKQLVYPKMKYELEGGAGIEVLHVVEGLLRGARTPGEVNDALGIAIGHFETKPDRTRPRRGHKAFARELKRRAMATA